MSTIFENYETLYNSATTDVQLLSHILLTEDIESGSSANYMDSVKDKIQKLYGTNNIMTKDLYYYLQRHSTLITILHVYVLFIELGIGQLEFTPMIGARIAKFADNLASNFSYTTEYNNIKYFIEKGVN